MEEHKTTQVPDVLPALILDKLVLFPNIILPYLVQEETNIQMVNDALVESKIIGVFSRDTSDGTSKNVRGPFEFGTAASILKFFKMPDGSIRIIIQGLKRIRIDEIIQHDPYIRAKVSIVEELVEPSLSIEALQRNVVDSFRKVVEINKDIPDEIVAAVLNIEEPNLLADFIASNMDIKLEERQGLLKEQDAEKRLQLLSEIIGHELKLLEIGNKIQSDISDQFDKSQRKFYLRQQLKAIKKELGEDEDVPVEVNEFKAKIKKAKMPKDAKEAADKQLERLKNMNPASAEYSVTVNYLDWLVSLPWSASTVDRINIDRAQKILDEDHYDLNDVKERILEFLAIRKLNKKIKGPILCFVGPPGVGKTSLGQSIARALGRKFIRMSLGGIRDEAEIRGHRRTYVGALPGRILQNLKQAKTNNPIFMLDEVDKIGNDFRGDPSSALLEVLDPEQNSTFSDHYVEIQFDLSNVMFIATANELYPIPAPLRDRMEIIQIPGYINEDKRHIAERFLVQRQIAENGLKKSNISFTRPAIQKIISDYTREAGVRNLEREIGRICRKIARQFASGDARPVRIDKDKVEKYLGAQKFFSEIAGRESEVGVATGLAWTAVGGEVLFIESVMMPGNKGFILTGQLGDVMKESARAALSYLRSKSSELEIDNKIFAKSEIHIHIPAGATPKDGPSAGITIATSLASLLTKRPVKHDIAMTGEITLRGKVMPVGGIREKVVAAKRAGIRSIIIPKRNMNDLEKIPENIRKSLHFHPVEKVDDVWKFALHNEKQH
ncbi:endopeptidase La [candidate division KSB1 bacterium]